MRFGILVLLVSMMLLFVGSINAPQDDACSMQLTHEIYTICYDENTTRSKDFVQHIADTHLTRLADKYDAEDIHWTINIVEPSGSLSEGFTHELTRFVVENNQVTVWVEAVFEHIGQQHNVQDILLRYNDFQPMIIHMFAESLIQTPSLPDWFQTGLHKHEAHNEHPDALWNAFDHLYANHHGISIVQSLSGQSTIQTTEFFGHVIVWYLHQVLGDDIGMTLLQHDDGIHSQKLQRNIKLADAIEQHISIESLMDGIRDWLHQCGVSVLHEDAINALGDYTIWEMYEQNPFAGGSILGSIRVSWAFDGEWPESDHPCSPSFAPSDNETDDTVSASIKRFQDTIDTAMERLEADLEN